MKRTEDQDDNANQLSQLTLLNTAEFSEMPQSSAPRLRQGEEPLRKADGSRKARPPEGGAVQLRLPGLQSKTTSYSNERR
jgi:hypothetical protein